MSEDLQTNVRPVSVAEAVQLAQAYPDLPLRRVFLELSHAEASIPLDSDNRAEVVARTVRLRLGATGDLDVMSQLPIQ